MTDVERERERRTLYAGNVSIVCTLGMLLCLLFSAIGGCIVGPPVDPSDPVPVTSGDVERLAYDAERAMPGKYADANEAILRRIESGDITSATALKAAIKDADTATRGAVYESRDVAFGKAVQPGDKWSKEAAAGAMRELIAGRRRAAR